MSEVIVTLDNLLDQEVKGYDFGIEYQTATTAFGDWNARLDLTYLDSHKRPAAPGQPAVERVGTYSTEIGTLAKYRANARLTWNFGNLDLSTAVRYVDGVTNTGSLLVNGRFLEADDYLQNDLNLQYELAQMDMRLVLGVENVFDEMPLWL